MLSIVSNNSSLFEVRRWFTLDKAQEVDGIAFLQHLVEFDDDEPSRRPSCRGAAGDAARGCVGRASSQFRRAVLCPERGAPQLILDEHARRVDGVQRRPCRRRIGRRFSLIAQLIECTLRGCRFIDHDRPRLTGDAGPEIALHGRRHGARRGLGAAGVEGYRLAQAVDVGRGRLRRRGRFW